MPKNLTSHRMGTSGKLVLVVLAGGMVATFGIVGFMTIEGMSLLDAAYMTAITLSTVGFGEVTPLHPAGRLFVIVLLILGIGVATSFAAIIGQQVIEGHFRTLVVRRKMENRLKNLRNHYVLVGFGRVGRQVAKEFEQKQVSWVVIEKEEPPLEQIVSRGAVVVTGDATEDEVLLRARIEHAHTLISTLPDEAQNVYLSLTARHMNPKLKIIARADYEEGEKKLLRAGADHVVIPHVLGGIRMAKAALQPHVVDFMQMASVGDEGLLVEELVVPERSNLVGKSLAETHLKQAYGITVIGVKEPGTRMNINPSAQTVLSANDVIVVVGCGEDLERFSRAAGL